MAHATFTIALMPDALGADSISLRSKLYKDTRRKPVHTLRLVDIEQPPERVPALIAKIDAVAEAYGGTPLFIEFRTFTWDGGKSVYWEAERESLVCCDAWWELQRVLFHNAATRIVHIPYAKLVQILTGHTHADRPTSHTARRALLEIQQVRMLIARRAQVEDPVLHNGPFGSLFRFPTLALLEMSTRGNVKRIVHVVEIGRMS